MWQCLLRRLSAASYSRRGLRAAGGGKPVRPPVVRVRKGCVDYGDVLHPHRRDAARRRCGRRSPRGQRRQHDPRLAELPMRMSGDRSLSSLTDDGGVGRKRGGKAATRNRTSPSGLSVGRDGDEKEREKSRDKQRALSPRALRRLGAILPTRTGASNIRNSLSQLVRLA